MSDAAIRKDVLAELDFESSINDAHIDIAVENGIVTLGGYVTSYAEKHGVEQAVLRVKGVRAIAGTVDVRVPNERKYSDEQIAERALKVLRWNSVLPEDAVKVQVLDGWVSLNGEVPTYYQRTMAEEGIRLLEGVVGIINQITVKPLIKADDVKRKIEEALLRRARVEASRIKVSIDGSQVILDGHVHDWDERQVVKVTAWAAPGVSSVLDRTVIG